jgi:flavodoxin
MMRKRTLVVYYSRTGNTQEVAGAIAQGLDADLEALHDRVARGGFLGSLRCAFDGSFHRLTELTDVEFHPRDYELVVLGTPIWNASVSSPMRTYLTRYARELPAVAFFCTFDGRGAERVLGAMAELARQEPVTTLAVKAGEVRAAAFDRRVKRFTDDLWTALAPVGRADATEDAGRALAR